MSFGQRLLWGIKYGLIFGGIYVVLAALLFILGGADVFDRRSTTVVRMSMLYLVGGFLAGAVVGTLLPLARKRIGAGFVGFLAAVPVGVLLRVESDGLGSWAASDFLLVVLFSLLLGVPTGMIYREVFLSRRA